LSLINYPKKLALSFIITFVIAIYGSLLALDGMKEWYPLLNKPVDIPMWLFAIVQPLYYAICITILYRLFAYISEQRTRRISLGLILFMMIFAESWNYLFLGLRSVALGFWSMLLFAGVAVLLFVQLRKVDPLSAKIFAPYLVWLLVDIAWMYGLWSANP